MSSRLVELIFSALFKGHYDYRSISACPIDARTMATLEQRGRSNFGLDRAWVGRMWAGRASQPPLFVLRLLPVIMRTMQLWLFCYHLICINTLNKVRDIRFRVHLNYIYIKSLFPHKSGNCKYDGRQKFAQKKQSFFSITQCVETSKNPYRIPVKCSSTHRDTKICSLPPNLLSQGKTGPL